MLIMLFLSLFTLVSAQDLGCDSSGCPATLNDLASPCISGKAYFSTPACTYAYTEFLSLALTMDERHQTRRRRRLARCQVLLSGRWHAKSRPPRLQVTKGFEWRIVVKLLCIVGRYGELDICFAHVFVGFDDGQLRLDFE